jgi:flagellar biosynthesis protein FliR
MSPLTQLISSRWPELVVFFLVLARTSGMMTSAPFWGGKIAPVLVRIVVTVGLSAAIYPLIDTPTEIKTMPSGFVLLFALAGEMLIGLLLGWSAQFLFAGMRLAGQQIELKIGIGLAQLIDPHEGGQTTFFAILLDLIAVLIFLAIDGHHLLVRALVSSYTLFPVLNHSLLLTLVQGVVMSAGTLFTIALQVSAPIIVALLLSDIVLAVVARAVPHLNIFLVAPPLQLALGMLVLLLALPALVSFCVSYFTNFEFSWSTLTVNAGHGK